MHSCWSSLCQAGRFPQSNFPSSADRQGSFLSCVSCLCSTLCSRVRHNRIFHVADLQPLENNSHVLLALSRHLHFLRELGFESLRPASHWSLKTFVVLHPFIRFCEHLTSTRCAWDASVLGPEPNVIFKVWTTNYLVLEWWLSSGGEGEWYLPKWGVEGSFPESQGMGVVSQYLPLLSLTEENWKLALRVTVVSDLEKCSYDFSFIFRMRKKWESHCSSAYLLPLMQRKIMLAFF